MSLSGCQVQERLQKTNRYFSITTFLDSCFQDYHNRSITVFKSMKIDAEKDSLQMGLDSAFWYTELAFFYEAEINKAAFAGQYSKKDSLSEDGRIWEIYRANDASLSTRFIRLCKSGQRVKKVDIEVVKKNWVYYTRQQLRFIPGWFYSIVVVQHIPLIGSKRMEVKGRFID